MPCVFLSLGGNIGNRRKNLSAACDLISQNIGKIINTSSIYETSAWGYSDDNNYFNLVIETKTELNPFKLLLHTKEIEKTLGRNTKTYIDSKGNAKYSARPIDIDILLYDQQIIDSDILSIPHAHMHKRGFVLVPLCEIACDKIHPLFMTNIKTLLKNLNSSEKISKLK